MKRRKFLLNTSKTVVAMALTCALGSAAQSRTNFDSDSIKRAFTDVNGFSFKGINLKNPQAIERIYAARGFAPLWSSGGTTTYTSKSISRKLLDSQEMGLEPTKYLGRLLHQLAANPDADQLLQFELVLTDSLYSYFDDLAHGILKPPGSQTAWKRRKAKFDSATMINEFFTGNRSFQETLKQLQPHHPRYSNLLHTLRHHQALQSAGGWRDIPTGRVLKPGDTSDRVPILRERLLVSGDLHSAGVFNTTEFDDMLVDGLKEFQLRHGLDADGILGAQTIRQLNVPLSTRIAQLQTNIDRWRWLPRDLGYSNILVNTAGYDLDVNIGGAVATSMKVIVGKPENKTPVFSDTLEHLVFNPSWYVPKSIAYELLEKESARPGWFRKNNFEIRQRSDNAVVAASNVSLDPDYFVSNYRVRQLAGRDNALGSLKFMFPNRYSVYMHDTNAKSLFSKSQRAFSHGCVRLEEPHKLATLLLEADGMSRQEIENLLVGERTKKVNLRTPLPVHMTYQTAWVDDYGRTHFRDDIYGFDKNAQRQLKTSKPKYAEAELEALSSTGLTVVINTY